MSRRERLAGVWLMTMMLLSWSAYIIFYVAKMLPYAFVYAYLALALMQVAAVALYLWGPEKMRHTLVRVLYRVLCLSSVFVLPSFMLQLAGLMCQYHAEIPQAIDATSMPVEQIVPHGETVAYSTETAYVIFPEYSDIAFVTEDRPSKGDDSITWCSGAAFNHSVSLLYDEDDIEGDWASEGTFHQSPHSQPGLAAFVFANGEYRFEFDDPSGAVREAAEAGGSGFMQLALIRDGETLPFDQTRLRSWRAMAELNGHLCYIDSKRNTYFDEFLNELQRLGVTHALYMDMGAGWNYSWYRDATGEAVTLFSFPVPWSHNWLVFRK